MFGGAADCVEIGFNDTSSLSLAELQVIFSDKCRVED